MNRGLYFDDINRSFVKRQEINQKKSSIAQDRIRRTLSRNESEELYQEIIRRSRQLLSVSEELYPNGSRIEPLICLMSRNQSEEYLVYRSRLYQKNSTKKSSEEINQKKYIKKSIRRTLSRNQSEEFINRSRTVLEDFYQNKSRIVC